MNNENENQNEKKALKSSGVRPRKVVQCARSEGLLTLARRTDSSKRPPDLSRCGCFASPRNFNHRVVLWIVRLVTVELEKRLLLEHLFRLCWDFGINKTRVTNILQQLVFANKVEIYHGRTLPDGTAEELVRLTDEGGKEEG